jgi:hypothetical protein
MWIEDNCVFTKKVAIIIIIIIIIIIDEEEISQSNRDAQDMNCLFASCYYERSKRMITRFVLATNTIYELYSF